MTAPEPSAASRLWLPRHMPKRCVGTVTAEHRLYSLISDYISFIIVRYCTVFVCTVRSLSKQLFHLHSEWLLQINAVEKTAIIQPRNRE